MVEVLELELLFVQVSDSSEDVSASSCDSTSSEFVLEYLRKEEQVAFKTGEYKQQVIFIGGLTHGLLATDVIFFLPVVSALDKEKWSLVQLLMSSSYSGFGTSSLKQDAQEIDKLISYLINKEKSEGVVLLGHSTGCQVIGYAPKHFFSWFRKKNYKRNSFFSRIETGTLCIIWEQMPRAPELRPSAKSLLDSPYLSATVKSA
ncbi:unnamed protein product [Arabis nemorensis]|uniref:Uncharacterized protein n=1 Tax=Arabis nemorensis TaxID=586526 RepID=A0A565CN20_9BRAS|nr:unnamed protein product [Arabis nemorensis]